MVVELGHTDLEPQNTHVLLSSRRMSASTHHCQRFWSSFRPLSLCTPAPWHCSTAVRPTCSCHIPAHTHILFHPIHCPPYRAWQGWQRSLLWRRRSVSAGILPAEAECLVRRRQARPASRRPKPRRLSPIRQTCVVIIYVSCFRFLIVLVPPPAATRAATPYNIIGISPCLTPAARGGFGGSVPYSCERTYTSLNSPLSTISPVAGL